MSNTTIMQLDRLETIAGELRTDEGMHPDGSLYDASHAIIELAYDIRNELTAEREKVQILREQIGYILDACKPEEGETQKSDNDILDAIDWYALENVYAATEGNAETCHCANCGTSDVSDSLLIECQGEPLCPECRPDDTEPTA